MVTKLERTCLFVLEHGTWGSYLLVQSVTSNYDSVKFIVIIPFGNNTYAPRKSCYGDISHK